MRIGILHGRRPFVYELAAELFSVDFQDDDVHSVFVEPIDDLGDLFFCTAMDEALLFQ
jgi:hypothetical protein